MQADITLEQKFDFITKGLKFVGRFGIDVYKRQLLGLAFDGNWEAMSSDIVFEPDLQRCIGVDVRYMPVSYTHLDVYKRQVRVDSMKTDTVTLAVLKFDRHPSAAEKQKISEWLKDVYKRQYLG